FSSRRRHTRSDRDWSSDVCSSDLGAFSRLMPDPSLEEMARNRVPLKRFGTPREIADAAAFLMSDGAGYITGDCLTVDGGEWLKRSEERRVGKGRGYGRGWRGFDDE